ncbi:hypothetical protein E4U32_003633 [Claviceps aff. humidiphila group G2b]|nr:hypothetical protein E4U32_003633 [Claviceps aff. humidiphila group G2b]
MHGEDEVSVLVGEVDVGLSVVVCRDSGGSLLTTVLKVVKKVEESIVTVDEESKLEADCEIKSDTEAELDVASALNMEDALEASDVPGCVRYFSAKLVGYSVLEEEETELAEVVDAADMLGCVLCELELIAATVLEAGFAVDTEDTAKVAPEAAETLASVLSASFELEDPMKLIGAVAVETDSVIDAEAAVETSGVLTRVRNFSFKLVGYAVPKEREAKLAEAAVDAAGMLDCELGKLALETAAVLESELAVDGADAADDAADDAAKTTAEVATEIAAEVAPEVAAEVTVEASGGILACVLAYPLELVSAIAVEKVSVVVAESAVEASGVLTRVGNLSFKLVGYTVPEERETELAEAAVDAAGMLDCELCKLERIAVAVLEAGLAVDAEIAAEVPAEVAMNAGGMLASVVGISTELKYSFALEGTEGDTDAEDATKAAGILTCVLSASLKLANPLVLMSTIAVEKVSVVGAEGAVETSCVLTRVRNFSFKLVGYAVPEEGETELAEAAVDAAGKLDCELGKLALETAAMLEAGFAVDGEDAAGDTAEVAPEYAEMLACVLSASFELEDPMKLIGAVSVETDSVIDAEGAVETSGVLTRVGNLCFKLVRYAVPEETETELVEAAVDAADMPGCELGKLELIA